MLAKEMKAATPQSPGRKNSNVSRPAFSSRNDAPAGNLTLQHGEPADAFLTGASRSLQRRVLGLNMPSAIQEPTDASNKGPVKAKHAVAS